MAESILAGISQEETQLELLGNVATLLSELVSKMPRINSNTQAAVALETIANGVTLSYVSQVVNLSQLGGQYAAGNNQMLAGLGHIYNRIEVS